MHAAPRPTAYRRMLKSARAAPHQQGDHKQHQKNEKQDFGDANRSASDAKEAQCPSDQCNDKKHDGVMQHETLPLVVGAGALHIAAPHQTLSLSYRLCRLALHRLSHAWRCGSRLTRRDESRSEKPFTSLSELEQLRLNQGPSCGTRCMWKCSTSLAAVPVGGSNAHSHRRRVTAARRVDSCDIDVPCLPERCAIVQPRFDERDRRNL